MTNRTIADFPPGTRVVRTAARNARSGLDVPEGARGTVASEMLPEIVVVQFDNHSRLAWGTGDPWKSDEWPLACIAPICPRPVGGAECGRELPCAVHDAAGTFADTRGTFAEPLPVPPRRLYMRERIMACAGDGTEIVGYVRGLPFPVPRLGPGATGPARPCRWCRGPCQRPVTHGEV